MASLILIWVWQVFPFVLLAVLARLQTIPTELYEAARVDGAGRLQPLSPNHAAAAHPSHDCRA